MGSYLSSVPLRSPARCWHSRQWECVGLATVVRRCLLDDTMSQQRNNAALSPSLGDSPSETTPTSQYAINKTSAARILSASRRFQVSANLASFVSRRTKNQGRGTWTARDGAWPGSACTPLIDSWTRGGTRRRRISP